MTEPIEPATPEAPQATPQGGDVPPWGDDFDPARAWHTITSLREREKELMKAPRMSEEQQQQIAEYQRLVEASKSEEQRREEAVAAAQQERDQSRAEATRLRVAIRHGISEDDFDLLGSGTEDEINARAERIAAKNKAAADAAAQLAALPPPPGAPAPRRPGEQLKPGATPQEPTTPAPDDYPADWLSPSQRAHLQRVRSQ